MTSFFFKWRSSNNRVSLHYGPSCGEQSLSAGELGKVRIAVRRSRCVSHPIYGLFFNDYKNKEFVVKHQPTP